MISFEGMYNASGQVWTALLGARWQLVGWRNRVQEEELWPKYASQSVLGLITLKYLVAKKEAQINPLAARLQFTLAVQKHCTLQTNTLNQAENARLTGIFWRCQSKLNNNITSAFATAVAGSVCFNTEQMNKNDWHKISTQSPSLNKGKLCNWKPSYVLFFSTGLH